MTRERYEDKGDEVRDSPMHGEDEDEDEEEREPCDAAAKSPAGQDGSCCKCVSGKTTIMMIIMRITVTNMITHAHRSDEENDGEVEPNSLTDSSHPVRRLSRGIGSEDQRRFLQAQSFSKWSQKRVGILKDFCVETLLEMVSDILVEGFGACHKKSS